MSVGKGSCGKLGGARGRGGSGDLGPLFECRFQS